MASRRAAEALIRAGRVTVNGAVVTALGSRADPVRDAIAVDGERLPPAAPARTVLLHKPRGVVTTLADPEGRPTVRDLLPPGAPRLFPVGRLDVNSTGLVLLTNDGRLAARLMHPRHEVVRVYQAKVRGQPDEAALNRLRRGVRLEDGKTAPAKVRVLERLPTKTWLEVTVHEGRTHLVRRMCDAVGHPVEKLARVRIGPLALGDLPAGAWRELLPREQRALAEAAGLSGGRGGARARRARGTPPRRRRPPPASRPRVAACDAAAPPPEARPRAPRRPSKPPRS